MVAAPNTRSSNSSPTRAVMGVNRAGRRNGNCTEFCAADPSVDTTDGYARNSVVDRKTACWEYA